MTGIERIEAAVITLSEEEYVQLRQWFLEDDWKKRDRQPRGKGNRQATPTPTSNATAELLAIPGVLRDVDDARKDIQAGRFEDWRKVRKDVQG
jgi:hypothetical protein